MAIEKIIRDGVEYEVLTGEDIEREYYSPKRVAFREKMDTPTCPPRCKADVLGDPNGYTGGECGKPVVENGEFCKDHTE